MVAQETEDEIADGVELVKELIDTASVMEREPVSVDKLVHWHEVRWKRRAFRHYG